ncbi:hypothetical protein Vretimale_14493, partial [Volvox reticuliferus]
RGLSSPRRRALRPVAPKGNGSAGDVARPTHGSVNPLPPSVPFGLPAAPSPVTWPAAPATLDPLTAKKGSGLFICARIRRPPQMYDLPPVREEANFVDNTTPVHAATATVTTSERPLALTENIKHSVDDGGGVSSGPLPTCAVQPYNKMSSPNWGDVAACGSGLDYHGSGAAGRAAAAATVAALSPTASNLRSTCITATAIGRSSGTILEDGSTGRRSPSARGRHSHGSIGTAAGGNDQCCGNAPLPRIESAQNIRATSPDASNHHGISLTKHRAPLPSESSRSNSPLSPYLQSIAAATAVRPVVPPHPRRLRRMSSDGIGNTASDNDAFAGGAATTAAGSCNAGGGGGGLGAGILRNSGGLTSPRCGILRSRLRVSYDGHGGGSSIGTVAGGSGAQRVGFSCPTSPIAPSSPIAGSSVRGSSTIPNPPGGRMAAVRPALAPPPLSLTAAAPSPLLPNMPPPSPQSPSLAPPPILRSITPTPDRPITTLIAGDGDGGGGSGGLNTISRTSRPHSPSRSPPHLPMLPPLHAVGTAASTTTTGGGGGGGGAHLHRPAADMPLNAAARALNAIHYSTSFCRERS